MTMYMQGLDLVTPTASDAVLAQKTSEQLATLLDEKDEVKLKILEQEESDEVLIVPASAMRLLAHILSQMAQGNSVTLTPVQAELSTNQAADLLNVSRTFLIQLLDKGEIPFHRVGTHRRVLRDDVMQYKNEVKGKRREALKELVDQAQELKMGY